MTENRFRALYPYGGGMFRLPLGNKDDPLYFEDKKSVISTAAAMAYELGYLGSWGLVPETEYVFSGTRLSIWQPYFDRLRNGTLSKMLLPGPFLANMSLMYGDLKEAMHGIGGARAYRADAVQYLGVLVNSYEWKNTPAPVINLEHAPAFSGNSGPWPLCTVDGGLYGTGGMPAMVYDDKIVSNFAVGSSSYLYTRLQEIYKGLGVPGYEQCSANVTSSYYDLAKGWFQGMLYELKDSFDFVRRAWQLGGPLKSTDAPITAYAWYPYLESPASISDPSCHTLVYEYRGRHGPLKVESESRAITYELEIDESSVTGEWVSESPGAPLRYKMCLRLTPKEDLKCLGSQSKGGIGPGLTIASATGGYSIIGEINTVLHGVSLVADPNEDVIEDFPKPGLNTFKMCLVWNGSYKFSVNTFMLQASRAKIIGSDLSDSEDSFPYGFPFVPDYCTMPYIPRAQACSRLTFHDDYCDIRDPYTGHEEWESGESTVDRFQVQCTDWSFRRGVENLGSSVAASGPVARANEKTWQNIEGLRLKVEPNVVENCVYSIHPSDRTHFHQYREVLLVEGTDESTGLDVRYFAILDDSSSSWYVTDDRCEAITVAGFEGGCYGVWGHGMLYPDVYVYGAGHRYGYSTGSKLKGYFLGSFYAFNPWFLKE